MLSHSRSNDAGNRRGHHLRESFGLRRRRRLRRCAPVSATRRCVHGCSASRTTNPYPFCAGGGRRLRCRTRRSKRRGAYSAAVASELTYGSAAAARPSLRQSRRVPMSCGRWPRRSRRRPRPGCSGAPQSRPRGGAVAPASRRSRPARQLRAPPLAPDSAPTHWRAWPSSRAPWRNRSQEER